VNEYEMICFLGEISTTSAPTPTRHVEPSEYISHGGKYVQENTSSLG